MANYAVPQPVDKSGLPLFQYPTPIKAKARYNDESNGGISSVITLTEDTTVVEIASGGNSPIGIRWVPRTETAAVSPFASVITAEGSTANFDHVIPANDLRRFVVPMEVSPTAPYSVQGANRLNGLYQRIAVKSFGAVGSVLVAEF